MGRPRVVVAVVNSDSSTAYPDGTRLHGEYKVSGGKLVVADVTVRQGRLADVVLSGDFFLEPDEALGRIGEALEGVSASAPLSTLVEAVESGRRDGGTR